jgi:hypothetical protein
LANPREVRIRQLPDRFDGKIWHTKPQPLVHLGDVGKWAMVRVAAYSSACPFVLSRKEWDKLPAQGIETRSAIDAKRRGPEGESPVRDSECAHDSPKEPIP